MGSSQGELGEIAGIDYWSLTTHVFLFRPFRLRNPSAFYISPIHQAVDRIAIGIRKMLIVGYWILAVRRINKKQEIHYSFAYSLIVVLSNGSLSRDNVLSIALNLFLTSSIILNE